VEIIAGVGGGAFVLVSLVLSIRLLSLFSRTRALPELACGMALLLMGAVGYPLLAVIQHAKGLPMGLLLSLLVAQMLCHLVANTAFCIFTLRVFRPKRTWARCLTAAVFLAVFISIVAQTNQPGLVAFVETGRGIWRFHAVIATVPLLWAAFESYRYHLLLERRRRLGLSDPVIVDRFRLWSISTLLAASVTFVSISLEMQGQALVNAPIGGVAIGVFGSLSAGAMWLAFMPPAAYVRWVSARAS
jgi:uncharacterized membrane-anchored protein YitT (DUF2179 family)